LKEKGNSKMATHYKLTDKGKKAPVKTSPAGQILDFMQNSKAVVNAQELTYELQIQGTQVLLDDLERAGYVKRIDEKEMGL